MVKTQEWPTTKAKEWGKTVMTLIVHGAKDEKQDNLSTEINMVENVTVDQDSGEENEVQVIPRYKLWKNHA